MSVNDKFRPREIADLVGLQFDVQKYQRGYKWGVNEVLDLLQDIHEFKPKGESFYCIQPLVVQNIYSGEKGLKYELIDGQQRLTTTFIILQCLNESLYKINYETRIKSKDFLNNICSLKFHTSKTFQAAELIDFLITDKLQGELNQKWAEFIENNDDGVEVNNIDNYHFFVTYQTVRNWLLKNEKIKDEFRKKLKHKTKVIWYEIISDQTPETVFINFNQGKIHLEQAELIKALFVLRFSNVKNAELRGFKTNQFSEEWNSIENQLQDDRFWYFVSNDTSTKREANRIDVLFDIISKKKKSNGNPLFSYHLYLQKHNLNELSDADWQKVRDLFLVLKEWFDNRTTYHFVGLVIYMNIMDISTIFDHYKKLNGKDEFEGYLKTILKTHLAIDNAESPFHFSNLNYNAGGYGNTFTFLVFFNVAIAQISDFNYRFPFGKLKSQPWSLEHIHAQNSEEFTVKEEVDSWLNDLTRLFESIKTEDEVLAKKLMDRTNPDIYAIRAELKMKEPISSIPKNVNVLMKKINNELADFLEIHSIKNLCLLDGPTNSSIGNENFINKRQKVLEIDKKGEIMKGDKPYKVFIPSGTKNVFTKYYSEDASKIDFTYWGLNDRASYEDAMTSITNDFLKI